MVDETTNSTIKPNEVFKPLPATDKMDKKTSRAVELQRTLQYKLKFNVVDELIDLYNDSSTKTPDKIRIALELMRYLYPQLKAMEIDQREGEKICVNITFPDDQKKTVRMEDIAVKTAVAD